MLFDPHKIQDVERWKNLKKPELIVTEGDSWFDYPSCDLISHINSQGEVVRNFAHYGNTLGDMLSYEQKKQMTSFANWVKQNDAKVKCFLLSAGGNDFLSQSTDSINSSPLWAILKNCTNGQDIKDYFDEQKFTNLMESVEKKYDDYLNFINSQFSDITIIGHGYHYVIPNGKRFTLDLAGISLFKKGPWLLPVFEDLNTPIKYRKEILIRLIDGFYNVLERMKKKYKNFDYVDFRMISFSDVYWENEIHPTKEAFEVLGIEFYNHMKFTIKHQINKGELK
jgi:hypothetical protein